MLAELLGAHRARYAANPDAARRVLTNGLAPVQGGADPVELAAWTSVARVLFNLGEAITRS